MTSITCPQCGKVNSDGNIFCIGCGQKLEPPTVEKPADAPTCPQCGKANRSGSHYCIGCGAALDGVGERRSQERANICPQCGKPLLESDSFCVFCGAQLDHLDAHGQIATQSQAVKPLAAIQQSSRAEGGKKRSETSVPTWMLIAISALAVILAALLLFVVFRPSGNSNTTQTATTSTSTTTASLSSSANSSAVSLVSEAAVSSSASSSAVQSGDYVLADSSTRYYTRAELEKLSALDLYHARNEIYARHGRGFKNDDLRSYFASKSWYHETISPEAFKEGALNDYEKQNVNLMLEIEKSRNSPYLS